jgi:hypothetical protein
VIRNKNNLFSINPINAALSATRKSITLLEAHKRLGHIDRARIIKMSKENKLPFEILNDSWSECLECNVCKITRADHTETRERGE